MTINLGDVAASSTVYVPFHTFDSNDPSASVTMSGLAITDIEIYKDGSVTQRASDNGYTLLDTDGIDFDGIVGLHGFSIDLSDNSDAGFYAAGSTYWVAVSSITVDGATINFWAAVFTIERTGGFATILSDTEAVLTDSEAVLADSEAIVADTNELQTDWANAGRLDTILDAVLADTEAAVPVLTDTEAILADSEAVLTDAEAILADTNELQTDWANAGRLDTILDAVLADTEAAVPVLTDTEAILADSEATLTDAEAILADTNELQTDWANAGRLDTILDAILVDSEAAVVDTEAILADTEAATAVITDTEAILTDSEAILADTETATYHADIRVTVDDTNSKDEYTVVWFKDGVAVTSGITSPTIQVIKRVDGTDLVASSAMTEIGSTGSYKYDEATNRITAGEAVVMVAGATIDSASREFRWVGTRDSS